MSFAGWNPEKTTFDSKPNNLGQIPNIKTI
jgi:hypothetical protein